jgi:PAS domain-containing protein
LIACESRLDAAVESSLIPFGACKALRDETGGIMDFEVVRLNRPAADFLGLNDAEAVGRRVNELLPNLVGQGLFEELRQVVETGRPAEKRGFAYQDRIDGRSIEGRFDLRAVKSEDGFAATWRRAGDQG